MLSKEQSGHQLVLVEEEEEGGGGDDDGVTGKEQLLPAELVCLSCCLEGGGCRWVVGWSCGYRRQWGWVSEALLFTTLPYSGR